MLVGGSHFSDLHQLLEAGGVAKDDIILSDHFLYSSTDCLVVDACCKIQLVIEAKANTGLSLL